MKFWILWGIDAVIALIVFGFFVVGLADGSVSSFNMGLWLAILAGVGGIVGGGLLLRSARRMAIAYLVLLVLAVPGMLLGLFFLILIIANPRWN
jgi:hypothetical protein